MAECDTGMSCSCGMHVTCSSSHAEDCQVFLTSYRKLLHCSVWHPLTPSHLLEHSFSSTCESAHIWVWARPLPGCTHLFLSSSKRLAISSLVPQDPLYLTSERAWEEDNPASLHRDNSTHVCCLNCGWPQLWQECCAHSRVACVSVHQVWLETPSLWTGGRMVGQSVQDAQGTACFHRRCFAGVPFLAHCLALAVWPKRDCSAWQPQLLASRMWSLDVYWFFCFSQTALIRHFILLEIPLTIKKRMKGTEPIRVLTSCVWESEWNN